MSNPYVGEIRMFGGNFEPVGWKFCWGQPLPISEYDVLFQLIGTTYGGDGQETFWLPDLRGRVPVHQTSGYVTGQAAGVETVTLTTNQIPVHTHTLTVTDQTATQPNPGGQVPARFSQANLYPYIEDVANTSFAPQAVNPVGGSQPHENMQPYLAINFIISLYGVFPSPT